MTIKEKRKKIREYCIGRECDDCELFNEVLHCGEILNNIESMPRDEVVLAYDILFGETKTATTDTPVLKDSGERREFSTGAVRDMSEGKGRMDLLPWAAIMEVSKHCENGCNKYGEHNVDKGIPTHSLCDSAGRHLGKYLDGWEDEPHLLAAAWNLLWAIQMTLKNPDMVDTPYCKYKEKYNVEKN